MAEASKSGPSIQSLIDKGLNACLKKLNLILDKTKASRSYPSFTTLAKDYSNYSELVWPREKETGPQIQHRLFIGAQVERQGQESVETILQEKRGYYGCQEEGKREAKRSKCLKPIDQLLLRQS